ncbi:DUF1223 domain-containing protein [Neotabrizicola sp. sgz301269]|uniref:DUF1223 domain-containing protein n=1 Tax=Neotabrizicola sp. sgz301269 TaxID=3276282 RepID=UPI00377019B4
MRQLVSAACGLWAAFAPMAQAENLVVVELFTSQGCSSCPPADDFVAMLAADPQVLPLSLHVDYWDYIGWADSFADPRFTERQKSYARAIGSRTIYTPQFIIGGQDRIEGFAPEETAMRLAKHLAKGSPVTLTVTRDGDNLVIHAEADPPLGQAVRVQLVRYMPEQTVEIQRGENAGKTITYRNVVTSWEHVGDWSGQGEYELTASAPGDEPAVVILQNEGPAAILAAARAD